MLYLCGDIMDKKPVIKKGSSGEMTDTRFFHSNHGRDLKKARRFIAGNQPFTQWAYQHHAGLVDRQYWDKIMGGVIRHLPVVLVLFIVRVLAFFILVIFFGNGFNHWLCLFFNGFRGFFKETLDFIRACFREFIVTDFNLSYLLVDR